MKIFKSINRLNNEVNFKANLGFVPTMGYLHKGHISLIESSKKKCNKTLVSIFVNPSQFNKKKDFNNYPRDLSRDIKLLKKLKVDYVFVPKKREIYKNKKKIKINIDYKDRIMCAKHRKGHFEGVLGIISEFLKVIKAKYIFLGNKDYQQIHLIKNFIKDRFATKVIACKTIRHKNCLAYSSRNFLLDEKDFIRASLIAKKMKIFYHQIKKNFKNIRRLKKIKNEFKEMKIKIDYLEIRNKSNLSKKFNKKNFKIFIAFYINKIRLIDNF